MVKKSKEDMVLFYIDDNTRVARDRLNFISQYRMKDKEGNYTDKWMNDRFFPSVKSLIKKVCEIEIRESNANDIKALLNVLQNLIDKLDSIKEIDYGDL